MGAKQVSLNPQSTNSETMLQYEIKYPKKLDQRTSLFALISFILLLVGLFLFISNMSTTSGAKVNTSAIAGAIMVCIAIGPTVLFSLILLISYLIIGVRYSIDDEKIYFVYTFNNKTFEGLFTWIHDLGSSFNIRGTSNVYLNTVDKIELREFKGKKYAFIVFDRVGAPFKYRKYIDLPPGEEEKTFQKLKELVIKAKFGTKK